VAEASLWAPHQRCDTAASVDTDEQLLQRWREGDRDAGSRLLARYINMLRAYFVRRVHECDPADLVQEVFLRMTLARDRFEGRSLVRTYVVHIARNVFREKVRELHRPNGQFDPLVESLAQISGHSQSSILGNDEELQLMLDAMQHIEEAQLELLELHYFYDYTQAEIAEIEEIPIGTVKSRIEAARRALLREFMNLLGPGRDAWTEDAFERGLVRVRQAVLRGQPRS
jgi:RNA polymerase sigma-70 factor, ECF subfamily